MPDILCEARRFIPYKSLCSQPCAYPFPIRLIRWGQRVTVNTPFACVSGREGMTPDDLVNMMGRDSYATAQEATAEARRRYPHFDNPDNQTVLDALLTARHNDGDTCGPYGLADCLGASRDEVFRIAHGKDKATPDHAARAANYKGRKV
jgi:hypothetical protein